MRQLNFQQSCGTITIHSALGLREPKPTRAARSSRTRNRWHGEPRAPAPGSRRARGAPRRVGLPGLCIRRDVSVDAGPRSTVLPASDRARRRLLRSGGGAPDRSQVGKNQRARTGHLLLASQRPQPQRVRGTSGRRLLLRIRRETPVGQFSASRLCSSSWGPSALDPCTDEGICLHEPTILGKATLPL